MEGMMAMTANQCPTLEAQVMEELQVVEELEFVQEIANAEPANAEPSVIMQRLRTNTLCRWRRADISLHRRPASVIVQQWSEDTFCH